MSKRFLIASLVACAAAVSSCAQTTIRVGAFPNMTHAQAMVGKANGWFQKSMGPEVKVQWTSFNAGPAAIEALFGGAIDMTYVGPNPAINGYVRSNGEAVSVADELPSIVSGLKTGISFAWRSLIRCSISAWARPGVDDGSRLE